MIHNLEQELGIKQIVLELVIYVTYNKTSNWIITYSRKCLISLTLFFINRMFILWCLKAYRSDYLLNFNEKDFTLLYIY